MSYLNPRLLSLSSGSNAADTAQMPRRSQRRTRPTVSNHVAVLRPLEPRPETGPHSGTTTGAAGLHDNRVMKKKRKPRAKRTKTANAPQELDSDGDSDSVVASDGVTRWKDGRMEWWDEEHLRWSMMSHYVVTLRYRY